MGGGGGGGGGGREGGSLKAPPPHFGLERTPNPPTFDLVTTN